MKATDDVFGAGDIVRFPLPLIEGETNIGHWQIAHNHGGWVFACMAGRRGLVGDSKFCLSVCIGRVAAQNMLGQEVAFNSIPYFWTVQYGKSVRYCGHALSWDEIVYDGSAEERKFTAYYIK